MESVASLFERFGGTRKMARALGKSPSTVQSWKVTRRIPSEHQDYVLRRGNELGLGLTAEDVMWPFPEDRPSA